MSLDHEPTARPVLAPKGRWGEYTQLSRQIKQAGCWTADAAGTRPGSASTWPC